MNIWHLKYFYEAAKAGNIKSAAEKFSISNSAISQAIKSLESELDVELLIHKKRFFELTSVGEKFLEKIPTLIHQLESFSDDLKNTDGTPQGTVVVGIPRSLLSIEFIDTMMKLRKSYPNLKFKIKAGVTSEIKKNLQDDDIQFGIIIDDGDIDQFSSSEISKGKFLLIAKNPKARLQNAELAITDAKKIEVISLLNEIKKRPQLNTSVEFEINSWSVIKDMVKKSGLIGYVPDYVVRNDLAKKKLYSVADNLKTFNYSIKVIWSPKRRQMPSAAALLVNEVRKNNCL